MRTLAAIGLLAACTLFAAEGVSVTEHMEFPPGGVLRLKNSIGELRVEGWDQPSVEITTIKSMKGDLDPKEREKAAGVLDKVRVTSERHGDELVLTTSFPRLRGWPRSYSLGIATKFDLEYDIKVPRNARLIVEHHVGEVHVDQLTADIHADVHQGVIVVRLPERGAYAIEAKSRFGSVTSDFPGNGRSHWWRTGEQFQQSASVPSQKLNLRVGYGDILLLRINTPTGPGPLDPSSKPGGL